jgi:hypothetical protein
LMFQETSSSRLCFSRGVDVAAGCVER